LTSTVLSLMLLKFNNFDAEMPISQVSKPNFIEPLICAKMVHFLYCLQRYGDFSNVF
jgi:hypothetical protein